MEQTTLHRDEIVRRGAEIYANEIRPKVEAAHHGKFLVLDIESHDYEISADMRAAYDQLAQRRVNGAMYLVRVGYPAVERFRGRFSRTGE